MLKNAESHRECVKGQSICRDVREMIKTEELNLPTSPTNWYAGSGDSAPDTTFQAGSIHKPEYYEYWENTLKANNWVLELLKFGYVLPLIKLPDRYEEKNNKSAIDDQAFVQAEMEKLQMQGVVKQVHEKPHCISPLTVATKTLSDGRVKKRLCWDGSRHINPLLKKEKVNLSRLHRSLEILLEGDFQLKYDLTSAFHHIKIHPEHVKYLGVSYENKDGIVVYMVFTHLPFGAASAVHCITKVMKPIVAHLAEQGIRHTIYLDDGKVNGATEAEAVKQFNYTTSCLTQAGWRISAEKSDKPENASQIKEYLGFIIDSRQMKVFLTEEKMSGMTKALTNFIKQSKSGQVKLRQLAKVLGMMQSMEPAMGNFPLIFARQPYFELELGVQKWGWKGYTRMSEEAIQSLEEFNHRIPELNREIIKTSANEIAVISILGEPGRFMKNKNIANHVRSLQKEIWVSDASAIAVCAYSMASKNDTFFIGKLSQEESLLSSGARELIAVQKALAAHQEVQGPWKENTLIYWVSDSTNLVTFLTKGSKKAEIQKTVIEIFRLAKNLNCRIQPIHLLREDPRIQVADAGSKAADTDDWSIDTTSYRWLETKFGPFTIDLFADEANKKCQRFYSDFLCPTSIGVDAFCHSWDCENSWICPPISKVTHVFHRLKKVKGRGVLVVPNWHAANYWPLLFPDGTHDKTFEGALEFNPTIIQNQRARSPLSGRTNF